MPDELHNKLQAELPGLNVSGLVQEAIRERLVCQHTLLACRRCTAPVDRFELIDDEFRRFYLELLRRLEPLVRRVGTAEGAARVVKDVACAFQVSIASTTPLPRPNEANRERAKDLAFDDAARRMEQTATTERRPRRKRA